MKFSTNTWKNNKSLIIHSIEISLLFVFFIVLILFLEIPRIKYDYVEELDGYEIVEVYGNSKTYDIKNEYKGKKVVGIGYKAFKNKTKLKSIVIPEGIIYINQQAFLGCNELESIEFSNSIEEIKIAAFMGCSKLNKVIFQEESKLKKIEGSAFFDCTNLQEVFLPSSLYLIGDYAFYNTNINSISISTNTKFYDNSLAGILPENINWY